MRKVVVFGDEEYHKIRELIVEIEDDIWDLQDPSNRGVMFDNMSKLKDLLGIYD